MTIEERVHNLERSARWWRCTSAVAVAVLAGVLLVGGKGEAVEELRVRKLLVVDEKGTIQMELGTLNRAGHSSPRFQLGPMAGGVTMTAGPDGRPSVDLYYKEDIVSRWTVGQDETTFVLYALNGKTSASLSASLNGKRSGFDLWDAQGTNRVALAQNTAESTLTLFNAKGDVRWQAPR